MERVKMSKVEVSHGNTAKKFPVYEIYLDGVIVTKVSDESDAMEMVFTLAGNLQIKQSRYLSLMELFPGKLKYLLIFFLINIKIILFPEFL